MIAALFTVLASVIDKFELPGFRRLVLSIVLPYYERLLFIDTGKPSRAHEPRQQQIQKETRGFEKPAMVRPPRPRRLRVSQLGQGQGRSARSVRWPAGDRHLQHLQRTHALQFALQNLGGAGQDRRVRGGWFSA